MRLATIIESSIGQQYFWVSTHWNPKELSSGRLVGLSGISESQSCAAGFFRPGKMMLRMPYKETNSNNTIEPMPYDDSDKASANLGAHFFRNRSYAGPNAAKFIKPLIANPEWRASSIAQMGIDHLGISPDLKEVIKRRLISSSPQNIAEYARLFQHYSGGDLAHTANILRKLFTPAFSGEREWVVAGNTLSIPKRSDIYLWPNNQQHKRRFESDISDYKLNAMYNISFVQGANLEPWIDNTSSDLEDDSDIIDKEFSRF